MIKLQMTAALATGVIVLAGSFYAGATLMAAPVPHPAATPAVNGTPEAAFASAAIPPTPPASPVRRLPLETGAVYSFDTTVYELRLNADQIGHLDVEALTKAAATSESLEKNLAALGAMHPLYRFNQPLSLNEEQFATLADARPDAGGAPAAAPHGGPGLAPGETGAIFDVIVHQDDPGMLKVTLSIKVAILLNPPTPATVTDKPPVIRTADIYQDLAATPNKPFLLVSVNAASLDANGKAVAFIARVVLGAPQSPSNPP